MKQRLIIILLLVCFALQLFTPIALAQQEGTEIPGGQQGEPPGDPHGDEPGDDPGDGNPPLPDEGLPSGDDETSGDLFGEPPSESEGKMSTQADDWQAPAVQTVYMTTQSSQLNKLKEGESVRVLVKFSKNVYFTSGSIIFNCGGVQNENTRFVYAQGSGSNELHFIYTVPTSGVLAFPPDGNGNAQEINLVGWTSDLLIDDGVFWSGGQRKGPNNAAPKPYDPASMYNIEDITDANAVYNITIDNVAPYVTSIVTTGSNGVYGLNDGIYFIIYFSEKVHFGHPVIELKFNNGGITANTSNRAEWPVTVDLNVDNKYVVYYKPVNGQSITQLLVTEIIPHNYQDLTGHPLNPAVTSANNLSNRLIEIQVPGGAPLERPFAAAMPEKYDEGWLRDLGSHAPQLYFGHRYWHDGYFTIWYYWSTSPDPDAAKTGVWQVLRWDRLRFEQFGIREIPNGTVVTGPSGVNIAGEYYIHFRAVDERTEWSYYADTSGTWNWVAGPFLIDQKIPVLSLPWDAATPLRTRHMIEILVDDLHSGVDQVAYQWFLPDGVTPYGIPQVSEAAEGRSWAIAPAEAGQYRLKVSASDVVGNSAVPVISDTYTVEQEDTPGNPGHVTLQFSADTWSPLKNWQWTKPGNAQVTISPNLHDADPGARLGQCFYLWQLAGREAPLEMDPRWVMFHNGLSGVDAVYVAVPAPANLVSGEYTLWAKAYNPAGQPYIAGSVYVEGDIFASNSNFPTPIRIDNTKPVVTITPNGSGPGDSLVVTIVIRDNLPLEYTDGYFALDSVPGLEWGPLGTPLDAVEIQSDDYEDQWGDPDHVHAWRVTIPPSYELAFEYFRPRAFYKERPAPPLYLKGTVEDMAGNETEFCSNPFYLDVEPPKDVDVDLLTTTVGPNQGLALNIDTHGEGGITFSYIVNGGSLRYFVAGSAPDEEGAAETVARYWVSPDAPGWSEPDTVAGRLTISLPDELALKSGVDYYISFRFFDQWGNEMRYPAEVTCPDGWDSDTQGDYSDVDEDYGSFVDVAWTTVKTFRYNPAAVPVPGSNQVTFSTRNWTNQNVTATLQVTDPMGYQVTMKDGTSNMHTFTQNGSHTFEYTNAASQNVQTTVNVSWIDKTAPQPTVRYSVPQDQVTKGTVLAEVYDEEPISVVGEADGNNDGAHIFQSNGTYTFTVQDRAGNTSSVTAEVTNIDRTPPAVDVSYTYPQTRDGAVTVTLTGNEEFVVLNEPRDLRAPQKDAPNGRHTFTTIKEYYFTLNASYTFYVEDKAGNSRSVVVSVSDIRPTEPDAQPVFWPPLEEITNGPVTVSLVASEWVQMIDSSGAEVETLTFDAPGKYSVLYKDAAQHLFTLEVNVTNIDLIAPQILLPDPANIALGLGEAFDATIGVSVIDNRDGQIPLSQVEVTDAVDVNTAGTYTVTYSVSDRAGNRATAQREVRVLSGGNLAVYVNGNPRDFDSTIQVSGKSLVIRTFGSRGECAIRWAEGQQLAGYFKNIKADGRDSNGRRYGFYSGTSLTLPLERGGWYTVFVQDYDRQTSLIHVYLDYK